MAAPNFWREVYFLPAKLFLRPEKRKRSQGLDQENMVDCRVTNKNHRCPSLVGVSGGICLSPPAKCFY